MASWPAGNLLTIPGDNAGKADCIVEGVMKNPLSIIVPPDTPLEYCGKLICGNCVCED